MSRYVGEQMKKNLVLLTSRLVRNVRGRCQRAPTPPAARPARKRILSMSITRWLTRSSVHLLICSSLLAACNPFAPGLDPDAAKPTALGDRRTVQGFFEYFRNAYQLRDSTLYGQLLTRDFTFTYTNFADNTQQVWTRDVDVLTTYRLFRGIRSASLQWTQYIEADTARADTAAVVERAFNLIINQDDENVYRGIGTARIELVRPDRAAPWRMRRWFDKSDF